jgi:hypothetical protein
VGLGCPPRPAVFLVTRAGVGRRGQVAGLAGAHGQSSLVEAAANQWCGLRSNQWGFGLPVKWAFGPRSGLEWSIQGDAGSDVGLATPAKHHSGLPSL